MAWGCIVDALRVIERVRCGHLRMGTHIRRIERHVHVDMKRSQVLLVSLGGPVLYVPGPVFDYGVTTHPIIGIDK